MAVVINEDKMFVQQMRNALKDTGGYCPCVLNPTEDDMCMCKEFRDKLSDPEYDGWCNCNLFHKVKEDSNEQ